MDSVGPNSNFTKGNCKTRGSLAMEKEENIHNSTEILDEADTQALEYQIAGHSRTGVLKHRLGYVLKPVQKMPLGEREVNFYKKVFCSNENKSQEVNLILSTLIPIFHGVAIMQDGNNCRTEYLMLEDVVQGFLRPCIIDIKIGKQTWDPLAPIEKIEHEKSKYTGTKNKYGISITGMQWYNIKEQQICKSEKDWGKKLNETTMYLALYSFLNETVQAEKILAEIIVKRLQKILEFFELQTEYLFYASSILIAYDGKYVQDKVTAKQMSAEDFEEHLNDWLRIRLIDFAHVFPANGSLDSNYLFGLKNIIRIFSMISKSQTDGFVIKEDGDNETKNNKK